MTHQITTEEDKLIIEFQHKHEELERVFNKEYLKIAKDLKVNGFRPGKVPISVAKNIIKINDIKEKVLNNFLKEEIDLLELEEKCYNTEIEIKNFEYKQDLFSVVKYYLYPTCELNNNYIEILKQINFKKIDENVSDKEIEKRINKIYDNNLSYKEVEEINSINLVLTADFIATDIETNEVIVDQKDYNFVINNDNHSMLLESNLIKCKKNINNFFEIFYPENYEIENLKNKKIKYEVLLSKIEEGYIPEDDGEFLLKIFDLEDEEINSENLQDTIKDKIKKEIIEERQNETDKINYELIIDALVNNSHFKISNYVINKEKNNIFKNFLEKNEINVKDMKELSLFLEKEEIEVENDFIEITNNKIKSYLILEEINKKEKIYEDKNDENKINDFFSSFENSEEDFLSIFENMQNFLEEKDEEFYLSKDKIKKIIDFIFLKIESVDNQI